MAPADKYRNQPRAGLAIFRAVTVLVFIDIMGDGIGIVNVAEDSMVIDTVAQNFVVVVDTAVVDLFVRGFNAPGTLSATWLAVGLDWI